ncbi:MAG: 23S rRNA (pseudouridine(1915)-N(3))-methyltransferase RlmH [Bacteroidetes bacterium]|nr:23S rRNA (pseudouridine(1915)-N(3))-methyltransferase RlmH [Bacteroidota bacterium]
MKIKIIEIGKTQKKELQEMIDEYVKRVNHYCSLEIVTLNLKTKAQDLQTIREQEGKLLMEYFTGKNQVVLFLLDEKGREYTSVEFSGFIEKQTLSGIKEIVFVIGGAYGFSDQVKEFVKNKIAISKMTFTHQMVRLLFVEQLYRVFTILAREKYHH